MVSGILAMSRLEHMDEFRAALLRTDDAPLPLPGALVTVDTTDFATVAL